MADKAAAQPQGPTPEELQELAMRGDQLRQQLAAVEQQRELLAELGSDARRSLHTLEHLETAKDGEELLVPLGAGAFVHAKLHTTGRVVASLGASIHAEMPVAEARERMAKRVESLDSASQQSTKDAQRLADEVSRIQSVLETYYGGA